MKKNGFSLIELLIALSIVGILLALSLPHYTAHLVREKRLTAAAELLRLASHMETFYAQHNSYAGATVAILETPETLAENSYRLLIQTATAAHFELAAIPQEQQAERDKSCGTLLLNSQGIKQISGTGSVSDCW
jgi:type IV pilus assembly protein PilE